MKDVAVVVIGYKKILTDWERISFKRCLDVFKNRDIFVVGPWNIQKDEYLEISNYEKNLVYINFSEKWFESVYTYGKMLMQKSFYTFFSEYKYILIYQLDCYAFQDNLDYFINLDYDYYGAPWVWSNVYKRVGNGGLSLRKISAFIENLEERKDLDYINSDECEYFIEDLAFCTGFYPLKNICPFEVGEQFSFETTASWHVPEDMKIEDFPMGLHGFTKPEFYECMDKLIKRWDKLNSKTD